MTVPLSNDDAIHAQLNLVGCGLLFLPSPLLCPGLLAVGPPHHPLLPFVLLLGLPSLLVLDIALILLLLFCLLHNPRRKVI